MVPKEVDVIIVGAGASGLMAARELSKSGKKVLLLEARNRIGGRIWSISKKEFGHPVELGAELVHGKAPIITMLAHEAGIKLQRMETEVWYSYSGDFTKGEWDRSSGNILREKLKILKKDMPIMEFLDKYFPGKRHEDVRSETIGVVEGYEAADPKRFSSFEFRDEWLPGAGETRRIKGGYARIIDFLKKECARNNVRMIFGMEVNAISIIGNGVIVKCKGNKEYAASKTVVTVPLPMIKKIKFAPRADLKLRAASRIGYGSALKIALRFKSRWWVKASGNDLGNLGFLISDQKISVWWPDQRMPVLIGWVAGPKADVLSRNSPEKLVEMSINSLSRIFHIEKSELKRRLVKSKVGNWGKDRFALGAYSYATVNYKEASAELRKPIGNNIFFAGEAVYSKGISTVEGALGSGFETARKIIRIL